MPYITQCYIKTFLEKKSSILPIFIPFLGCPQVCVYCNQTLQTGSKENINLQNSILIQNVIDETRLLLPQIQNTKKEIAFYGGTFTALKEEDMLYCLNFIKEEKKRNSIQYARCSTRPDAISPSILEKLKEYGMDTIELGIQSFHAHALKATKRGYSPEIAKKACTLIKEAGFRLCIQLLPNLPSQSQEEFIADVTIALSLKPDYLRFYPCLVIEGTKLALLWQKKKHKVWDFNATLESLAQGLFLAWKAEVPVIRIGVAPEPAFYQKVLAGVHHKALGQLVQSRALELSVEESYALHKEKIQNKETTLFLPYSTKGYYMPEKNKEFWKNFPFQVRFTLSQEAYFFTPE